MVALFQSGHQISLEICKLSGNIAASQHVAQVLYWEVSYKLNKREELSRKDGLLYNRRSNVNLQVLVRVDSKLVLTQLSTWATYWRGELFPDSFQISLVILPNFLRNLVAGLK